MKKIVNNHIDDTAPNADAGLKLVERRFHGELPHNGELFLPNDDFYNGHDPRLQAQNMAKILGSWLGIKPGYIHLEFGSAKYKSDSDKHHVILEQKVLHDEFVLGAKIAYELTRYLVEKRKQISLSQQDQHSALLANASVEFGLGLVILNGIKPKKLARRSRTHARKNIDLLNGFLPGAYAQMITNFTRKHHIDQSAYSHLLTPWAADAMYLKVASSPTHAVRDAKHKLRVASLKSAGVIWLGLLVLGMGIYVAVRMLGNF